MCIYLCISICLYVSLGDAIYGPAHAGRYGLKQGHRRRQFSVRLCTPMSMQRLVSTATCSCWEDPNSSTSRLLVAAND